MQDFRKLDVWRRSHGFVLDLYRATAHYPDGEKYGLTGQTRRAAVSIPANIAEGCGRETQNELRRFLYLAMGSASELEYHLLLARDLSFLAPDQYQQLANTLTIIRRQLNALIQKLASDDR